MLKNCCLVLRHFDPTSELRRASVKGLAFSLLRACTRVADTSLDLVVFDFCAQQLGNLDPPLKQVLGQEARAISMTLRILEQRNSDLYLATHHMGIPVDAQAIIALDLGLTFLWNITDETPWNAEEVVRQGGLGILERILQNHPTTPSLCRSGFGMVANVAEVPKLRPALLKAPLLLGALAACLDTPDNLVVNYNVVGILCNLLAEVRSDCQSNVGRYSN